MMKFIVLVFAIIAYVSGSHVHVAPPAVVAAQSSQVIARNYNGIVTPAVVPFAPILPPKVFSPYVPFTYPYSPYYYPYVKPFYYYK